jgi:hypothetical protein
MLDLLGTQHCDIKDMAATLDSLHAELLLNIGDASGNETQR